MLYPALVLSCRERTPHQFTICCSFGSHSFTCTKHLAQSNSPITGQPQDCVTQECVNSPVPTSSSVTDSCAIFASALMLGGSMPWPSRELLHIDLVALLQH